MGYYQGGNAAAGIRISLGKVGWRTHPDNRHCRKQAGNRPQRGTVYHIGSGCPSTTEHEAMRNWEQQGVISIRKVWKQMIKAGVGLGPHSSASVTGNGAYILTWSMTIRERGQRKGH